MRDLKPYELADAALTQLRKRTTRRATITKRKLLLAGFDELNVIREIYELYELLDDDARRKYRELYRAAYMEMAMYLGVTPPTDDELDETLEMYLAGLLDEPNELTRYAYDTEVLRKRDRAVEAINSVPSKLQKQLELDKAMRHWNAQTGYYADIIYEDAQVQALEDNGVQSVQRHERDDDKTCQICLDADGEIYPIDKIPPKPHLHCRRWFTPAE